ncbi:MAG: hypothetical protein V4510_09615 [bacterium]
MKARDSVLNFVALLLLAAPARATFTLTISTAGPVTPSAIVTSTPSGIVCPGTCSAAFAAGSTVTVGEVAPSTMTFIGWSAPCRSNLRSCTIRLSANTSMSATFAPLLDVAIAGTGLGAVSILSQPVFASSGSAATRSYVYPTGSTIIMRESTGTASSFTGWSGDGGCDTASTCTVTLNSYEAITATFVPAAGSTFTLAVLIPNGGGTVTSIPAGIACPGVCRSTFTPLGAVTLTTAAAAGYRFAGWANGGCSRNQACVVNSTSPLQGLGGPFSPAAYFYPVAP